jgi:hypothetical protein
MPRNPEQDRDRPDDQTQSEADSQAKVWPKSPDQQDKTRGERTTDTNEPAPESSHRVPGKDEAVRKETSDEEDEEIAKKMSRSGHDGGSTGVGG